MSYGPADPNARADRIPAAKQQTGGVWLTTATPDELESAREGAAARIWTPSAGKSGVISARSATTDPPKGAADVSWREVSSRQRGAPGTARMSSTR
jgi:hypothetical protein